MKQYVLKSFGILISILMICSGISMPFSVTAANDKIDITLAEERAVAAPEEEMLICVWLVYDFDSRIAMMQGESTQNYRARITSAAEKYFSEVNVQFCNGIREFADVTYISTLSPTFICIIQNQDIDRLASFEDVVRIYKENPNPDTMFEQNTVDAVVNISDFCLCTPDPDIPGVEIHVDKVLPFIQNLTVEIECNPAIIVYMYGVCADIKVPFDQKIEKTETGYRITIRRTEEILVGSDPVDLYETFCFQCVSDNKTTFSGIHGTVMMQDETSRAAKLDCKLPSERILTPEQLPKLKTSNYYFDGAERLPKETTVAETVAWARAELLEAAAVVDSVAVKRGDVVLPGDEHVCAGDSLVTILDDRIVTQRDILILGDTDGNGEITAADARLALCAAARISETTLINKNSADLNRDGHIAANEARAILRVSAQLDVFDM